MKFLQVYCERRKTTVYLNMEKIALLTKSPNEGPEFCLIEMEGLGSNSEPVAVKTSPEELIKMINGEDKSRIGFRTGS